MKKRSGFTLVEVMVSMIIMGLTLIAGFSFFVRTMKIVYNWTEDVRNLDISVSSMEDYRFFNGIGVSQRLSYNAIGGNGAVANMLNVNVISEGDFSFGVLLSTPSLQDMKYRHVQTFVIRCIAVWPVTQAQLKDLGITQTAIPSSEFDWLNDGIKVKNMLAANPNMHVLDLITENADATVLYYNQTYDAKAYNPPS